MINGKSFGFPPNLVFLPPAPVSCILFFPARFAYSLPFLVFASDGVVFRRF
jgi:hypothetical protein